MLLKLLKYVLLSYMVLCGAFYFYQQHLFFHPKKLNADHRFSFQSKLKYTDAKIPFDSSTVIDVIKFQPALSKPKGVVLFFHGNRYNVEHYAHYAPYFTSKGYECWMPDYPGFGRSTGDINVAILKESAMQLYKMARVNYSTEQILIYGKSLGSGIAADLGAKRDCGLLMLETPYHSLSALVGEYLFMLPINFLMKDDLSTYESLQQVTAPVLAWHGNNDELIPLSQSARLLQVMKPQDKFYVVEGAKHNSIPENALYKHSIDSAFSALGRR